MTRIAAVACHQHMAPSLNDLEFQSEFLDYFKDSGVMCFACVDNRVPDPQGD
jgi:hypothetical protein